MRDRRLFSCCLFARRLACRLHDDEVREIPREGRLAATVGLSPVAIPVGADRVVASLVGSPIPCHDDRKLGGSCLQRVEAAERSTTNDDFDGVLLFARCGTTARCRCFGRHASRLVSAAGAGFFDAPAHCSAVSTLLELSLGRQAPPTTRKSRDIKTSQSPQLIQRRAAVVFRL
jgi:hypothetical protein